MDNFDYGYRYLTHKAFIELCKKLEITDCDELRLEFFERKRILFPVRKIVLSSEYAKYKGTMHNDPRSLYHQTGHYEIPDKWDTQFILEEKIKHWQSISSAQELFHILDKRKEQFKQYIRFPSVTRTRKWKSYEVAIKRPPHNDFISSRAIHLYAYWQAYPVYEIVRASKIWLFIDLTEDQTVKALWKRKIPMKKVLAGSLPFKLKSRIANISSRNNDFDALSFYVQSIIKLRNFMFLSWQDNSTSKRNLEEATSRRYRENERRLARLTIKKFAFTEDQFIDFLKFLCKKYFEYQEEKMDKLSEMVRSDIRNLTYLISDGYKVTVENIIKKVGRVTHHFKNTLDVIFPDKLVEAKENASHAMKSFLTSSPTIKEALNVTDNDIENFLNYMEQHDLVLFFQTIDHLSSDWFSNETFSQSGRQSDVMYLSLLLEVLLKTIGRDSEENVLVNYFSVRREFLNTLKGFYKEKLWWSLLKNGWVNLTDVTNSTDIQDLIENKILKATFSSNNSDWDNLIKMFLVCGVARNLSAHEHHKLFRLNHEVYQLMIGEIVSALLYSWKFAEEKKLVKPALELVKNT